MGHTYRTATVFGGTGFVGTQVVRGLAKKGFIVKVATRVPESAFFLRPCGVVGQIVPFVCDYSAEGIAAAVKDTDIAVNCVGILHERKKGDFARIHRDIPAMIAAACCADGVKRLVHLSIPNIEQDTSRYAVTKLEGEKALVAAFPDVTILRPSVIFGPDDNFFNKFATLSAILPVLPLIGGGKTRFQPVYVGDVADAVMACVERADTTGQVYELGGPETLSFRDIYVRLFSYTGIRRPFIVLPWRLAKIQAFFMSLLPQPLLTPDQVESLKTDYVINPQALSLRDLGLMPTPMSLILPRYLERYRRGGKFSDKKAA